MTSGMMKKNKIHMLLLVLASLVFSLNLFASNIEFNVVMENMSQISRSTALFEEEKSFALLNKEIKLSGRLEYIAPDTIIKKTMKPEPELFKVNGNELYIEKQNGDKHNLILSNYPLVAVFTEAYRGVLSGDIKKLKNYYDVDFRASSESWTISLTPLDEDALQYIEMILVEGIGTSILRITTIESGGDKSIMNIKEKK